jgi:hypothetical protein
MWTSDVIAALAAAKSEGMTFETAWATVIDRFPPSGRDAGPARMALFSDDGETPAEFLRRVAADAWEGRRPVLRHLAHALELIEQVDEPRIVTGRGHGAHALYD